MKDDFPLRLLRQHARGERSSSLAEQFAKQWIEAAARAKEVGADQNASDQAKV